MSGSGTAPEVDLDGDGLVNLLECAFRTAPLSSSSAHAPAVGLVGSSLALTHRRNKVTALIWTYEVSTDLVNWTVAAPTLSVVNPDLDGDGKTELVRAVLAAGTGEPRKFARIAVALP